MMIKTEYIYKNPLDNGYKKFKLSKKVHNQLFKHRQIKWIDRYEYYYNDKQIILHNFYNPLAIILNTIMFPISVLLNGIINIKECWLDLKKSYNQKKYGSFSSDSIYNSSDIYKKIMDIINEKRLERK
jgi:hypothetical protein